MTTKFNETLGYPFKSISFDKFELLYLRLIVHDVEEKEINRFLDCELDKISSIRTSLQKKFKQTDWRKIISISIKKCYLNKVDYIDDTIKSQAYWYAYKIFDQYCNSKIHNMSRNWISKEIIEFLTSCDKNYHSKDEKVRLDFIETKALVRYLELKYEGLDEELIHEILKVSKTEGLLMKFRIFKMLKVYNWYNAIKKAFKLNILCKSDYLTIDLEEELRNYSYNIERIKKYNKYAGKEKALAIYNELISIYLKIEDNYLHRTFEKSVVRENVLSIINQIYMKESA